MFHVELQAREKKLTMLELWSDAGERALALCAIDFFLARFLTDIWFHRVRGLSDVVKINMFRWDHYREARRWIVGHKALSATLVLRRAFPGWQCKKS